MSSAPDKRPRREVVADEAARPYLFQTDDIDLLVGALARITHISAWRRRPVTTNVAIASLAYGLSSEVAISENVATLHIFVPGIPGITIGTARCHELARRRQGCAYVHLLDTQLSQTLTDSIKAILSKAEPGDPTNRGSHLLWPFSDLARNVARATIWRRSSPLGHVVVPTFES